MIDTHAHLLYYDNDGAEIINSMNDDGLEIIVNIGTTLDDSIRGVKLASENKNIYTTVGIYPEHSGEISDDDLLALENLAKHEKVVAIGEIGLDYHQEGYDKETQKRVFLKQLEMADRLNIPFCIHCRNAVEDVYEILQKNKHLINHSGLMHCYSEGKEWYEKFIKLGLFLSFSGNITFKKNDRSFLKDIPLNRILIETDSPYLSPEPLRGRKNEPKNLKLIMQKIADEIGLDVNDFEKITSENARKFYFKIND